MCVVDRDSHDSTVFASAGSYGKRDLISKRIRGDYLLAFKSTKLPRGDFMVAT